MDKNLSKAREIVKDREVWHAGVSKSMELQTVGHKLAAEQQ